MSYELADGSMSTDHKIGDEFQIKNSNRTFVFTEDDGTNWPWFKECGEDSYSARPWACLTSVKPPKNATLVKSIRSTIQFLERTIQELES